MLAFDLEASIMSAESTILSAKERKESRGAHQRSDFEKTFDKFALNFIIELKNSKLNIKPKKLKSISKKLNSIINKTKTITDFDGMLLE